MKVFRAHQLSHFVIRHYRTLAPFLTLKKALNVTLCLIEMKLGRTKCISRPFVYRVDPSTACNLRCPSCEAHTIPTKEKRLLDFPDFSQLVAKIKTFCVRLSLYDTGEPLVNKDIFKMIELASTNGISTSISTNFTLFRQERHMADLFRSGLTVLAISLDGITSDTYSKYRVRGDVERVKASLEAVIRRKRTIGAKLPVVDVQVLELDHLVHHKESINRYLNVVGADKITWKEETWGFNAAKPSSRRKPVRRPDKCFWLYLGPMIRPDGNVYPCCGRGFGRFAYGNVADQDIDEIWNNRYYQFSRALFSDGPTIEYQEEMKDLPCHSCTVFEKRRVMQGAATRINGTAHQQYQTALYERDY